MRKNLLDIITNLNALEDRYEKKELDKFHLEELISFYEKSLNLYDNMWNIDRNVIKTIQNYINQIRRKISNNLY